MTANASEGDAQVLASGTTEVVVTAGVGGALNVSTGVAAALVLSHIAAVPALIFLVYKQLIAETAVLATAVWASTAFHMCQVEWFCFGMTVESLQIGDHFMVFFALIWFLLYASGTTERVRVALSVAIMGVSLPIIISNMETYVAGVIVVGIAVAAFLVTLVIYSCIRGTIRIEWRSFAVALVLIGLGTALHVFGGDFGDAAGYYPTAHTVWHVLAFFAIYYTAMVPFVQTSTLRGDGWVRVGEHATAPRAWRAPSAKESDNEDNSAARAWTTHQQLLLQQQRRQQFGRSAPSANRAGQRLTLNG